MAHAQLHPSEGVLGNIGAALEEFERTLEATRAARRDHVGASGDLDVVMSGISEQVRLLEGLVRYRFGDDAELIPAWTRARNVLGRSGPGARRARMVVRRRV